MNRTKITVDLWPEGHTFEGKRIDSMSPYCPTNFIHIEGAPADLELLLAEFRRTRSMFAQEAAFSLAAALREWREEVAAEDDEPATSAYVDHEERREEPCRTENVPYDPTIQ